MRRQRLRPPYLAIRSRAATATICSRRRSPSSHDVLASMDEPADEHAADARTVALRIGSASSRSVGLGYLHAGPGDVDAVGRRGAADQAGVGTRRRARRDDRPARRAVPGPAPLRSGCARPARLTELRDAGNTVIAVEHDAALIRAADDVIEIGPGPGRAGGRRRQPRQRSVGHPGGTRRTASRSLSATRREPTGWMHVTGVRENNLRGLDVRIPLGVQVGVCGVSGSGKSSLVVDTIALGLARPKAGDLPQRHHPGRTWRPRRHLRRTRPHHRRRPVPGRDHVARHVPGADRCRSQVVCGERSRARAGHHDQGPHLRLRRLRAARGCGRRACRSCPR